MSVLVDSAKILGIDKIGERANLLKKACGRAVHGEVLFYICGYDYITSPSDGKFNGLRELFLTRYGALRTRKRFISSNCVFE